MLSRDHFCYNCKHSHTPVDKFPCSLCCHGNGRYNKNYFQEKKTVLTESDIKDAVERLKKVGMNDATQRAD